MNLKKLKSELYYDFETGIFTRLKQKSEYIKITYPVGNYKDSKGHLITVIDYRKYKLAYLAHLYMTGEWPKRGIRYLDGNKENLKFNNLSETGNKIYDYWDDL